MEQEEVLIGIISISGPPIIIGANVYEGPYTVTPKLTQQSLLTADKNMTQDVTVFSIPYAEVSNPKGYTVIIGD